MTDRELVQRIMDRDQTAFRELVDSYQQNIIRTCYALVHHVEDAEDLAQEVFMEVYLSVGSYRGDAKLSSWIYRIAVNKSLNFIRKQTRRDFLVQLGFVSGSNRETQVFSDSIISDDRTDQPLVDKETKKILHWAIESLPVNQRISFILNRYEDLSYKEISEVMELSLSSVESLLHRAKYKLQKKLAGFYHKHISL